MNLVLVGLGVILGIIAGTFLMGMLGQKVQVP